MEKISLETLRNRLRGLDILRREESTADVGVRRKRADSPLQLTSLKRKKKTERLDELNNRQSPLEDYNDSIDASDEIELLRNLQILAAYRPPDYLSSGASSPSVLPASVNENRSVPEAATFGYEGGANLQPDSGIDSSLALADIGSSFDRFNLAASSYRQIHPHTALTGPPPLYRLHSPTTKPATELRSYSPPRPSLSTSQASSPFPTPTHKPVRPRIITSMMSRRIANLPTRKGGAPTGIPQFVSVATNISTDSTESQGSVRTQVPGSYHDQNINRQQATSRDNEQYYGQSLNGSLPSANPDLNSSSTFMSMAPSHAKGLNPNSRAFQPPTEGYGSQYGGPQYGPQLGSFSMGHAAPKPAGHAAANVNARFAAPPAAAGYGAQHTGYAAQQNNMSDYGMSAGGGNGIWDRRGPIGGYQVQQQQNIGNMPEYMAPNALGQGMGAGQYQAANSYGPNHNGGPPTQSFNGPQNGNPYSHFGQGDGMNGYGFQGNGQVHNGFANGPQYAVGGLDPSHQINQYGSASGSGYQAQGQIWGGQYHEQNQCPTQAPYVQPSNANRGKPAYYNIKSNATAAPYNPSNLATAPVAGNSQGGRHPEFASYAAQNGGSVQAPSRVNSASPTKSKASTANSSAEPSSSLLSNPGQETVLGQGSPTPVGRRRQEFSSEPRNSLTPTLRSRRGQTVIPSTAPSTKQAMVNWLENIAEVPPPKMLTLDSSNANLSGGDILAHVQATGTNLTSFNGGAVRTDADPFVGPRPTPTKLAINPFATPQHLNPFMGGGLLPKPAVSAPLRRLVTTGKPSIGEALESANLPFVEYCRMAREDTWGVIKIKNIPYSVNRPEVLAFLGRNARIINEQDFEPVHIVMERVTSKTLDCYVEFINFNEAVNAVNRFETNRNGGRGGRLGQRHVEVELSCQEQLMHDLFPKAKNVTWSGSRPIIKARDLNDEYNSGFKGFISREELVMLVKHVEAPQRSPFSKDCPQRPFECLISTLLKYPWYMVDYITIEDRNQLHKVTLHLIDLLQERISSDHENLNLNPMLLKRVWRAALKCPGFSPSMKDDICWKCGIDDQMASEMGVPAYAAFWKDLWTIGPKPGAPNDIILFYAALIREAIGAKAELTLAEKAAKGHQSAQPSMFGELVKLIDLPKSDKEFRSLTLSQCASAEWAAIEQALRRALTPALTAGPNR